LRILQLKGSQWQKSIAQSHAHRHSADPFVPQSFFCRHAEFSAPELIGLLAVGRDCESYRLKEQPLRLQELKG